MEELQDGPTLQDTLNQNCKKQTRGFFRKISDALKWNSNEMELLMDIGCGSGERSTKFLSFMYPRADEIIAIDPEEKNIEEAITFNQYPKVNYVVADIGDWSTLEYWEGKVSHMVSLRHLNFVLNQKIAFKNMFSLLKPGGEAALLIPVASYIYEVIRRVKEKPKWKPYFIDTILIPESHARDWQVQEYEEMLKKAGFTIMSIMEMETRVTYPSEELYQEDIMTTLTKTIPKELKKKFADEIVKDYRSSYYRRENGNKFIDYDYMCCFLRKPGIV